MLKDTVDVGGKVFANRLSPVFLDEVPCVLVYFKKESLDVYVGDKYNPKTYERNLTLIVDILITDDVDPTSLDNENDSTEDKLDDLATQVEKAIGDDPKLKKMLKGYDPNRVEVPGLLFGSALTDVEPYTVDIEGETKKAGQRLVYNLVYESKAWVEKKPVDFNSYKMSIYEVKDGKVTDQVLSEAEGTL